MLTIAGALLLWFTVIPAVRFLLIDAVWQGADRNACGHLRGASLGVRPEGGERHGFGQGGEDGDGFTSADDQRLTKVGEAGAEFAQALADEGPVARGSIGTAQEARLDDIERQDWPAPRRTDERLVVVDAQVALVPDDLDSDEC